ncbi:MAG TPA: methyltransferase domain-containing protein [Sandaracinaceae bacterium LLY-WYZ-13_1]|nr:methyltransferase domain-containing protein [Sandaracinaceae bacterium LLY-WYZ-13_1]
MVDITQPGSWDRVAGGYAQSAIANFEPYAGAALRLAGVNAGERVLDVATGPGTLAIPAAAIADVTAVDFSPEMIAIVRARAADRELHALTALVADGQALPFDDEQFDVAFSMFGLFMFEDRAVGFRELARVLRPGGRAVVGSWPPRDADHPFTQAGRLLQPEGASEEPSVGDMPLSDPRELRREMGAAGFDVRVERFDHTLRFDSASALAQTLLRSHVGFAALAAEGEEARYRQVASSLEALFRRELGEGAVQVPLSAWLGLGVKES